MFLARVLDGLFPDVDANNDCRSPNFSQQANAIARTASTVEYLFSPELFQRQTGTDRDETPDVSR